MQELPKLNYISSEFKKIKKRKILEIYLMEESFSGFELGRDPMSHRTVGFSELKFLLLDPIAKMGA